MAGAQEKKSKKKTIRIIFISLFALLILGALVNTVTNEDSESSDAETATPTSTSIEIPGLTTTGVDIPSEIATSIEAEASSEAATESNGSGGGLLSNMSALVAARLYSNDLFLSKERIYEQLIHDGYSAESARYAADNVKADFYKNALETARSLEPLMVWPEADMYEMLTGELYLFTPEEAQYAIDNL
ncbi:MAG: Ltp family lipoprotein [Corynebacterium sp.]|nr:Ltp family lipoprotein [Corynebacterium sp.]